MFIHKYMIIQQKHAQTCFSPSILAGKHMSSVILVKLYRIWLLTHEMNHILCDKIINYNASALLRANLSVHPRGVEHVHGHLQDTDRYGSRQAKEHSVIYTSLSHADNAIFAFTFLSSCMFFIKICFEDL